ncbi:MAG: hypothetical protein HY547_10130 [Elusimicrobia bacterium]|nr:hypothetical protein [Elusimicrobiota bacterium]
MAKRAAKSTLKKALILAIIAVALHCGASLWAFSGSPVLLLLGIGCKTSQDDQQVDNCDQKEDEKFIFGACQLKSDHQFDLSTATGHFAMCVDYETSVSTSFLAGMADSLETSYNSFVSYGFPEPNDGGGIEVYISRDYNGGHAGHRWVSFYSGTTAPGGFYTIAAHELFHTVQSQMYCGGTAGFNEGAASWAMDIVNEKTDKLNIWKSALGTWLAEPWQADTEYSLMPGFWKYVTGAFATQGSLEDFSFGASTMLEMCQALEQQYKAKGDKLALEDFDKVLKDLFAENLEDLMARLYVALYAKDLDQERAMSGVVTDIYDEDYLEDEEAGLNDMALFRDSDELSAGASLSYDNSGDEFLYFGDAAPVRVKLSDSLREIVLETNAEPDIHYAAAIEYERRDNGEPALRHLGIVAGNDTAQTLEIYTSEYPDSDYQAVYLLVIPFSLEEKPSEGNGSWFSFAIDGE